MSHQRLKCPRGHSFSANVYSRYQRVTCPTCTSMATSRNTSQPSPSDPLFGFPPDLSFTADDAGFGSGGGGSFAGGGASGSWGDSSSSSDSSSSD